MQAKKPKLPRTHKALQALIDSAADVKFGEGLRQGRSQEAFAADEKIKAMLQRVAIASEKNSKIEAIKALSSLGQTFATLAMAISDGLKSNSGQF